MLSLEFGRSWLDLAGIGWWVGDNFRMKGGCFI